MIVKFLAGHPPTPPLPVIGHSRSLTQALPLLQLVHFPQLTSSPLLRRMGLSPSHDPEAPHWIMLAAVFLVLWLGFLPRAGLQLADSVVTFQWHYEHLSLNRYVHEGSEFVFIEALYVIGLVFSEKLHLQLWFYRR
jgi:hypothetical protein